MKTCEEMYNEIRPAIEGGDRKNAMDGLERLLQSYPQFAQAHYELGILYHEGGDKRSTMEHYQMAVNLSPKNVTFLKRLGDYYYSELGNTGEAVELFRRVVEVSPEDIEALLILGNLSVVENEFETAKDYFRSVLEIEPWNQHALMFYEKLDKRQPRDGALQSPEEHYEYSQQLVQAGHQRAAIRELEKLIASHPEYAPAHNDLGVLYFQNGMKDKTLARYEAAVRLAPGQLNFQKNLADFYAIELGRIEEALELYAKVLSEDPTDIEALMAAAYISQAVDRNDHAKIFFERILDIEPWNYEASEKLNQLNLVQCDE